MGAQEYAVLVARAEQPQALVGAPWERAQLRRFASQVALPGRSRLGTAAGLSEALTRWVAARPPEDAARALPISRMRRPWSRWWRETLLHAAHPRAFCPPEGAYVELSLRRAARDGWLPSPAPTVIERRLAANALRALLPGGSLDAEIARRQRPGWNQIIPQAMMWELAVSDIRRRSFTLRLMLPAEHADGLAAGAERVLPLSLSL